MSRLNDIEKLRGWCHKILPLVYDDSLSYYEVLCKVRTKINEVIDLTAEQNDVIEEAVQEITDWETTTDEKYNQFVEQMDEAFDTFKGQINDEIDTFETTVNGTVTQYKNDIDASETQYKTQMKALYDEFLDDYLQTLGVVQTTGTSTTNVMSQKATTDNLDAIKYNLVTVPNGIEPGTIDNTGVKRPTLLTTRRRTQNFVYYDTPITITAKGSYKFAVVKYTIDGEFVSILRGLDTTPFTITDTNALYMHTFAKDNDEDFTTPVSINEMVKIKEIENYSKPYEIDVSDKLKKMVQHSYLGITSTVIGEVTRYVESTAASFQCSLGTVVYRCNRSYKFIKNNSDMRIRVVKLDASMVLLEMTDWLNDDVIVIEKNSCTWFSIILQKYSGGTISDLDDFVQDMNISVTKEPYDTEDLPIIMGIIDVDINNGNTKYTGFNRFGLVYALTPGWREFVNANGYRYTPVSFDSEGEKTYYRTWMTLETITIPCPPDRTLLIQSKSDNTDISASDLDTLAKTMSLKPCDIKNNKTWVMSKDYNVVTLAHQGDKYISPPNTLPGFKGGYYRGFRWIESDIRLTADGVPVMSHDDDISSHSNGTGLISQMTLAELDEYDFGSFFAPCYEGTKICRLAWLLEFAKYADINLSLELKPDVGWTQEQVQAIYDLVEAYGMKHKIWWNNTGSYVSINQMLYTIDDTLNFIHFDTSFNATAISRATSLIGTSNEVYLFTEDTSSHVTAETVKTVHSNGLLVGTHKIVSGTNDQMTETRYNELVDMGVDAFIVEAVNTKYYDDRRINNI